MTDVHCHYLPGVDDGARTLDQGLELLRCAAANGIERIVLTPHIHPGRYNNTLQSLRARFEAFRLRARSAGIPVRLALGGEVRFGDELLPLLERNAIPLFESAAGEKTLLLEFPHQQLPPGAERLLRWLRRNGIATLVAHPERNKSLMKDPARLQLLLDEGALVQVTAAAVIGKFGDSAKACARYFLDRNWVTIVATDAHNINYRPPLLREAAIKIARRYGEDVARRLVVEAPAQLSAGNFAASAATEIDLRRPPPELTKAELELELEADVTRREPTLGDGDLCGSAFQKMELELRRRAHHAGNSGRRAARILDLMRDWQAQ